MIVVDTNVIAYLWIPGEHTKAAEKVLSQDSEWAAPLLWRSELRNILAGCIRRKLVTADAARQLMEAAEEHMRPREYTVSSPHVLSLVEQSSCSAYDCEFVALAEDLATPLVTCDKQILIAFPSVAVSMENYLKH